jgi:hypothetical protein
MIKMKKNNFEYNGSWNLDLVENHQNEIVCNFSENFNKFINLIESKIEDDVTILTLYDGIDSYIDLTITREGSSIYDIFIEKNISIDIIGNDNNFVYENTLVELRNIIYYHIINNLDIFCILSVKTSGTCFFKKYGFDIFNKNEKFEFRQLSAKDICNSYKLKLVIPFKKNEIYCGLSSNDIICGFDII